MSINDQPEPILIHILSYLNYVDHLKSRSVCQTFLKIIDSEQISGTKPTNIYECILDDNVYYLKNYLSIFNKKIMLMDIICYEGQQYNLTPNFFRKTFGEVVGYFCSKYLPKSKIYTWMISTGIDCCTCEPYLKEISIKFILDIIITDNNILIIKKLDSITNMFNDDLHKLNALINSSKHGHLDIIKYILENNTSTNNPNDRANLIHDITNIIISSVQYNHFNIVKYIFDYYLKYIDCRIIFEYGLNHSSVNLLKIMYDNKLLNTATDLKLFQTLNTDIGVVNYLFKIKVRNLSKIFIEKIIFNDITQVKNMLRIEPNLINHIDSSIMSLIIGHKYYTMVDLLIKHGATISGVEISRQIIYYARWRYLPIGIILGSYLTLLVINTNI